MTYSDNVDAERLRKAARDALAGRSNRDFMDHLRVSQDDPEKLLEELQIYHTELELQAAHLREATLRLEVALTRSRQLFNNLPHPAFVVDTLGQVLQSNKEADRVCGLEHRTGLFGPLLRRVLTNEGDATELQMALIAAERSGAARVAELAVKGDDGVSRKMLFDVRRLDNWDDLGETRLLVHCLDHAAYSTAVSRDSEGA